MEQRVRQPRGDARAVDALRQRALEIHDRVPRRGRRRRLAQRVHDRGVRGGAAAEQVLRHRLAGPPEHRRNGAMAPVAVARRHHRAYGLDEQRMQQSLGREPVVDRAEGGGREARDGRQMDPLPSVEERQRLRRPSLGSVQPAEPATRLGVASAAAGGQVDDQPRVSTSGLVPARAMLQRRSGTHAADELGGPGGRERCRLEDGHAGRDGLARDHDQQREVVGTARELRQRGERRSVGAVGVVDDQRERAPDGERMAGPEQVAERQPGLV